MVVSKDVIFVFVVSNFCLSHLHHMLSGTLIGYSVETSAYMTQQLLSLVHRWRSYLLMIVFPVCTFLETPQKVSQ